MSDALQWLKTAFRDEPEDAADSELAWESFDLAFDYLSPGNATKGDVHTTPDGKHTFEVVDTYFRRIEEEEVWVVLKDENGVLYKVAGEFTSWDSIEYKIKKTKPKKITTTVWS